jgi:hypothetical protein
LDAAPSPLSDLPRRASTIVYGNAGIPYFSPVSTLAHSRT